MRFASDGKFRLAELPILDAMTQGRTRSEVFMMVALITPRAVSPNTISEQDDLTIAHDRAQTDTFRYWFADCGL